MPRLRISRALLAGVLVQCLQAPPAAAQTRWNLEARGGAAFPSGNLGRVADAGTAFGAGVGRWVLPKLGVRLDAEWQRLPGARPGGVDFPDVETGYYSAGLEMHLVEPGLVPWTAVVGVAAGVATLEAVRREPAGSSIRLDETYPAASLSVSLGYDVRVGLNVFVRGSVNAVFGREDDLVFLPEGDPGPELSAPPGLDTTVSFPLELGVRFDFFRR